MARTKEQEEFVKMTLRKAMTKDPDPQPHQAGNFDNEVEHITKSLQAQYADKKK